jgi:hypothetical protein
VAGGSGFSRENVPLTLEMLTALERKASSERGRGVGCAVAGLIGAGALALLSVWRWVDWKAGDVIVTGVYMAVIAMIIGVVRELIVRADVRGGVYRRIAGPIIFVETKGDEGGVTYEYRIGGETFRLEEAAYSRLRHMTQGSVEFAPRSHTLFALRDHAGTQVYPRVYPRVDTRRVSEAANSTDGGRSRRAAGG